MPAQSRAVPIHSLTPEQIETLQDLRKLKQEVAAEVERLIAFLDLVDGYALSELEDQIDDGPIDGPELEPSLGSYEGTDQEQWASGNADDHEGDEHDGREPDEADYEPSVGFCELEWDSADDEPHLGWPERTCQLSGNGWCDNDDREQCVPVASKAAHARYRRRYRHERTRDGRHIVVESCYGGAACRVLNLTDQQRSLIASRVDRESGIRLG